MMNDSQVVLTVLPTFAPAENQYDSLFLRNTFLRNYRQNLRYQPYHPQFAAAVAHHGHHHHFLPPPVVSSAAHLTQTYMTGLDLSTTSTNIQTNNTIIDTISRISPKPNANDINDTESTHVSCLYPEILALIFRYLDVRDKGRAAQVCCSWRDAAYSKSVWRGVEAKLHLRRANPQLFQSLNKRGIRKIQVLSLRRSLKDVITGVTNIERLNLSGCFSITDTGLSHAFSMNLPSITQLDLSLCKQISDASLLKISQNLRNLEVLELGGCCHISNTGLLVISYGLQKLKKLNLRSCWHVSDNGIGYLAGISRNQMELDLDDDETAAITIPVTAAAESIFPNLLEGGNSCSNLEFLGLQDCQRLTDEALRFISLGLPKLKSINLSFCVSITDSGLRHLSRIPTLSEINLRACDNITDLALAYLSETSAVSSISLLDVSFCDKISDLSLTHISQGLFKLKTLSLSACRISDEGLKQIASSLPELEVLHIGQCNKITDKGLSKISENLNKLRIIDLYGCTRVSSTALDNLLQLPELQVLNLGLFHR